MGCLVSSCAKFPVEGYKLIKNDTGCKLIEDCCSGMIIYINFRRGLRYSAGRITGFAGSIAVTNQRILLYNINFGLEFQILFENPNIEQLEYGVSKAGKGDVVYIRLDWNIMFPQDKSQSGKIEYRLRTKDHDRAQEIVNLIQSNIIQSRKEK